MEPLYKIEEQSTVGWTDWDEKKPDMTREECAELFQTLVQSGINPDDLRFIRVE